MRKGEAEMIERLRIETERYTEETSQSVAKPPRLSLAWYLDPITGKPVAHWVVGSPEQINAQKLGAAA
jgi:hypothetical protein